MDNKRLLLAVVLCLAVSVGWNYFAEYMGWLPKPAQQEEVAVAAAKPEAVQQQAGTASAQDAIPANLEFNPTEGREVVVDTPLYRAVFHSNGGVIKHFSLKNYRETIKPDAGTVDMFTPEAQALGPLGLIVDGSRSWLEGNWQFEGSDISLSEGSQSLVFTGSVNGLLVRRTLTFAADSYLINENVDILNEGGASRTVRLDFSIGTGELGDEGNRYNMTRVTWFSDESGLDLQDDTEELAENGLAVTEKLLWGGVMDNYFLAAIAPVDSDVALKARYNHGVYQIAMQRDNIQVGASGQATVGVNYYIGPKESAALEGTPNVLVASIDYGFFSVLAKPLVWFLNEINGYVGNYGVAIIILTIIIKIVFWPLSHKSYKSMESMKKLQPMMQKIREKYADDKERMNQEVMSLYKTYKVNPAGGCLPMVLQIPVFIGLYQGLLNSIELRHASFIQHLPFTDMIWLADLSAADPYYITPIVMGVTMLLQQKLTPSAGDPMQQKMMMIMPLIFTFMFLSFPAGLVVYWLVNNVLSIAQQWFMLRKA